MQPEALVRDLYEAFRTKAVERLRELLAPNIEWNQCPGFPGGKNRRGVDDVLDGILGTNHSLWRDFSARTDEFLVAGNTVVVLGHYSGHHTDTGKAMRSEFAHIYRVVNDQVVRFDQIADTQPMVAAATT